ncbi:hypothetical protein SDC9_64093 [bioreactor metagenome]|uniref:Uncharacterized protein n=1 Tax=bioreactor metagenome TaxID=1076179 RepID=A0A644XND6_9ZZZZ
MKFFNSGHLNERLAVEHEVIVKGYPVNFGGGKNISNGCKQCFTALWGCKSEVNIHFGLTGHDVAGFTSRDPADGYSGTAFKIVQLSQTGNFQCEFLYGIAADFRLNSGVCGTPGRPDRESAAALSFNDNFSVFTGRLNDDRPVAALAIVFKNLPHVKRADFLVARHHHRYSGQFLRTNRKQRFEGKQRTDQTGLLVQHAGAVGNTVFDAEGICVSRPFQKNSVEMADQQYAHITAGTGGDKAVPTVGMFHDHGFKTERLIFFFQQRCHAVDAMLAVRAAVNRDKLFEQCQHVRMVSLKIVPAFC